MRTIHLSSGLCLFAVAAAMAGEPGPFDIETLVADGMWNNRSSVEIDADGVVHLVWAGQFSTDSTTAEVYYANNAAAPGGGSWHIQQLTFNNVREEFPCLTLDQDGNVHVAVHTGIPGGNHIRYTNNVGAPPGEFNDWIHITPDTGPFYVIVDVRIDSQGVAHFAFRSQTSVTGEDIFYTTWSQDGGVGPLVNLSLSPGVNEADSHLALGPDDAVHVVWTTGFIGGALKYKKKAPGGNFEFINTGVIGNVIDPVIQVSHDNVVSIIYRQNNVLWLVESGNGGTDTFSAPQAMFTGVTAFPSQYERFALDANGRRHIAFSTNSQELRGVWYIGEDENGFMDPIHVAGGNTGNQSNSIAIGPGGEVAVTYSISGFDQVVFADLFVATLSPDDPSTCPGDLTGSGTVGVPDLLALLACWGPVDDECEEADLTDTGNVGVPDLLGLLANWGPCP